MELFRKQNKIKTTQEYRENLYSFLNKNKKSLFITLFSLAILLHVFKKKKKENENRIFIALYSQ